MPNIDVAEPEIVRVECRRIVEAIRLLPGDRGIRQVAVSSVLVIQDSVIPNQWHLAAQAGSPGARNTIVDLRARDIQVGVTLLMSGPIIDIEQFLTRKIGEINAHSALGILAMIMRDEGRVIAPQGRVLIERTNLSCEGIIRNTIRRERL